MSETSDRPQETEDPSDQEHSTKHHRQKKKRLQTSSTTEESSDDKLQIEEPCRKRRKAVNLEEAKELIDSGMDEALQLMASKKNLTKANIKNILWHVVTNENVLSMVRNTMLAESGAEPSQLEEANFEPRITRSKARQIEEAAQRTGKPRPPWLISPVKQPEVNKKSLLEVEFSESDDEEFDPEAAGEKSDEEESFMETPSSPPPSSQAPSEPETSKLEVEEDQIFLRTRSKLPLQDTPLECLEAQLIAPDLEFNTLQPFLDCRDEDDQSWKLFLEEFQKPLSPSTPPEEDNDPDFKFLEEEDVPDFWELRSDKCVNISKRELNQLWRETLAAQNDGVLHNDDDDDEEEDEPAQLPRESLFPAHLLQASTEAQSSEVEPRSSEPELQPSDSEASPQSSQFDGELFTPECRLLLEEQMRMHVQLLTQTVLLGRTPDYMEIANNCYLFLFELDKAREMSQLQEQSAFNAFNLPTAIQLIQIECQDPDPKLKTCRRQNIPQKVQDAIAYSTVFIYPLLLPTCNYNSQQKRASKPKFIEAEDHLLALGLEEFGSRSKSTIQASTLTLIRDWLMPTKTVTQLRTRIKNLRFTLKPSKIDNPVHHFLKFNRAPACKLQTLYPFNPSTVVPPIKQPASELPQWMVTYLIRHSGDSSDGGISNYRKILPKLASPLKAVSPIIKKYRMLSTRPRVRVPKFNLSQEPVQISIPSPTSSNGTLDQLQLAMVEADIMQDMVPAPSPPRRCVADSTSEEPPAKAMQTQDSQEDTCEESSSVPATTLQTPAPDSQEDTCEDEQDLAALMQASTTIQRQRRRKAKSEREMQSLLALLDPGILDNDPKKKEKKENYVKNYLMRVKEALSDKPEQLKQFIRSLVHFHHRSGSKSIKQLYKECMAPLKDHPALISDFIPFLTQQEAKECGLYREHLNYEKMKIFVRKLEVYTKNQPQKMIKALRQCQEQIASGADLEIPLVLRNNPLILEDFIQLVPRERPPDSLMTDFEEFTLPDSGDDGSRDSVESFQPPKKAPEQYGTRQCPCQCHATSRDHCEQCGTRFLGGRVFRRCGTLLRPAQVVVLNGDSHSQEVQPGERTPEVPASSDCEDLVEFDSPTSHSTSKDPMMPQSPSEANTPHQWTRDDDGLLLKTFKVHGIRDEVYQMVASQLGIVDIQQVKERFHTLMKLFESHSKKNSR